MKIEYINTNMPKTETKLLFVCEIRPLAGQYLVVLSVNGKEHLFLEDTRLEALDTVFNLLEDI